MLPEIPPPNSNRIPDGTDGSCRLVTLLSLRSANISQDQPVAAGKQ